MAERILDHEAAHAGPCIEDRKDEKRFKHDGEVVPDRHQGLASDAVREDVGHADGERRCASGAIEEGLLADGLGERMHVGSADRKSPT